MTLLRGAMIAALAASCGPVSDRNTCERAGQLLHRCGVSLPYLSDDACVGARVQLADCVLENADDCVGVAELTEHVDDCLSDLLDEAEDVPDVRPGVDLGTGGDDITPEDTDPTCSDGIDNDVDGDVDCGDSDCLDSPLVTVCG